MLVLVLYAAASVANIVSGAIDNVTLERITKPLLMPLLALWLWRAARARGLSVTWVIAALLFSAAGDMALMGSGTWFIIGMVLFLCAHICYITTFIRHGALARLKRYPVIIAPIAVILLAIAALVWLWPGLWEIGMAIPMAAYAVALTSTAALSTAFGWVTGLGGCLFLLSDMLIAVKMAGHGRPPGPEIWVMVTYVAAQFLLASGWLSVSTRLASQNSQPVLSLAGDAGEHVR